MNLNPHFPSPTNFDPLHSSKKPNPLPYPSQVFYQFTQTTVTLNNGVVLLVTCSLFTLPELLSSLSLMLLNIMSLLQHFGKKHYFLSVGGGGGGLHQRVNISLIPSM